MAKEFDMKHYLSTVAPRLRSFRSSTKKGKINFKDLDGNLIMSRSSDTSYWEDASFVQYSLESDARIKGVKVVNIVAITADTIDCTVDYLRHGR